MEGNNDLQYWEEETPAATKGKSFPKIFIQKTKRNQRNQEISVEGETKRDEKGENRGKESVAVYRMSVLTTGAVLQKKTKRIG